MNWKSLKTREAAFDVALYSTMILAIAAPCIIDRLWAAVFFIPFTCVIFLGQKIFDIPNDGCL